MGIWAPTSHDLELGIYIHQMHQYHDKVRGVRRMKNKYGRELLIPYLWVIMQYIKNYLNNNR